MNRKTLALLLTAVLLACNASAIVYVDRDATGVQDGTSWATAYRTLQAGIDAAAAKPGGDEVWVAEGVYNENRTEQWGGAGVEYAGSLVMKDNVHVYGGFRGGETLRRQRIVYDHATHYPRTIINGATSRGGSAAYHVVVFGKATSPVVNARLDGFGITGGNANGITGQYHTYRGGGIYNWISSPVIANCMIWGNVAQVSGGGMANESSRVGGVDYAANAELYNCVFFANQAGRQPDYISNPVRGGGGIFFNRGVDPAWTAPDPAPLLINCTFYGNTLGTPGYDGPEVLGKNSSGIYNFNCTPVITNCIVYGNAAGQILDQDDTQFVPSPPLPTRVSVVSYSNVQGGWLGAGNTTADPQFINAPGHDFRLNGLSLAVVNAGTNSVANLRDLRGVTRPRAGTIDIGAFEFDNVNPTPVCNSPLNVSLVDGTASITAADVDNGSTDITLPGEDIAIYHIDQISFDCADLEACIGGATIPVVLTVTDYANNSASCTAQVSVQGGTPYIVDPTAITLTPNQGTPLLIRTYRGQTASFSFTACGGNTNREFTWYFDDGVNPPAALTSGDSHPSTALTSVTVTVNGLQSTLSLANLQEVTSGDYYCELSDDSANPPALTAAAELVVKAPVAITAPAPNYTLPSGSDVSWTVTASGGYGPPYNYQWQRNIAGGGWVNVPADGVYNRLIYPGAFQYTVNTTFSGSTFSGSTPSTLSIEKALLSDKAATPTPYDSGLYRVLVNDGSGLAIPGNNAQSAQATLTLTDVLKFVVHPQDGGELYVGDSANFSVAVIGGTGPNANPIPPGPGYFFEWTLGTGLDAGQGTTSGCTNTLSRGAVDLLDDGEIQCKVTDWGATPIPYPTALSEVAFMTVRSPVAVSTPADGHRNTGGSITFNVTASEGYPGYTYQWYYNDGLGGPNIGLSDATPLNGATVSGADQASLTVSSLTLAAAGNFYCVATDSKVTGSGSVGTSAAAALTVTDLLSVGPTTLISSTHGGTELYEGEDFTLQVTASGGATPYTYQWYRGATPVGGNSNQLVVTGAAAADTGAYTCVVDDASLDPAVTSAALTMTVYRDLAITQSPPANQTRNVGQNATFTVVAADGWGTTNYQWQIWNSGTSSFDDLANGGRISGVNSATLTISLLEETDAGMYRCRVFDSGPGPQSLNSGSSSLAVTNFLILAVDLPPTYDVYTGDTITLQVTIGGGNPPYNYVWYKEGQPGFSGPNSNALVLTPAHASHVGEYYVVATDQIMQPVTSARCVVSVYDPLAITGQPDDVQAYVGEPAAFEVAVSGGIPPVTLQWEADFGGGFAVLTEGLNGFVDVDQAEVILPAATLGLDNTLLQCVVSATPSDDPLSANSPVLNSNIAELRVGSALNISTPLDAKAYVNAPVDPDFEMSAFIDGGFSPSHYQWQRRLAGQGLFAAIPGGGGPIVLNSAPLLVSPAAESANLYEYRVAITDGSRIEASDAAEVEFDEHLSITQQPLPVLIPEGGRAEFTVAVSGGLGDIEFEWLKLDGGKGGQKAAGTASSNLVIDPVEVDDEGDYQVNISDAGSSVSAASDMISSNVVKLTIGDAVPVAGLGGLALLSLVSALAGVSALRRRRQ